MKKLEVHEFCEFFPDISGTDWESFKEGIRQTGQLEPIVLLDGKILDGKNRHRACVELGIEPITKNWNGESGDPLSYVIEKNLKRRDLNQSQKAVIAAVYILPLLEAEARERRNSRLKQNQNSDEAGMPERKGQSRDIVADLLGSSGRYIQDAKKINNERPDLIEKILAGKMSIPKALKQMEQIERRKIKEAAKAYQESGGLENIKVIEGNSLDEAVLDEYVDDSSVDLIILDPPYEERFYYLYEQGIEIAERKLNDGGYVAVFCGDYCEGKVYTDYSRFFNHFGNVILLYWGETKKDKNKNLAHTHRIIRIFYKGEFREPPFMVYPTIDCRQKEKFFHKWEQPLYPTRKLVQWFSREGELVLDPFCGGGTTLVACYIENRRAFGFDIDPNAIETTNANLHMIQNVDTEDYPLPLGIKSVKGELNSEVDNLAQEYFHDFWHYEEVPPLARALRIELSDQMNKKRKRK